MLANINLWNPTDLSGGAILLTAFLLGIVHGITPDEHTWPITFSYAIGSYSRRKGLAAGLTFSLAFTLQRALGCELAYLGLAKLYTYEGLNNAIYVLVGIVMAVAGVYLVRRGRPFHVHFPWSRGGTHAIAAGPCEDDSAGELVLREPQWWMPAVHGFIAGWGFGAFAIILYTTLAPAMPSAATAWLPGALYGLGTTLVQALAGALFGSLARRRGFDGATIRRIALVTAARTLTWGGLAFVLAGLAGYAFPAAMNWQIDTGIRVHNLDAIGVPFLLVIFAVVMVGFGTLVSEFRAAARAEPRTAYS
ncbi:MAG: hypothetical protein ACREM8_02845 [Vulcanimicrobiaceae bacterium]